MISVGSTASDLCASKGDKFLILNKLDDWWQVQLGGKVGYLPAAYCQDIGPHQFPKVKALYSHTASDESSMSFNAGDTFDVLDSSNPSWYSAKNHRTGAIGYVPVNFMEALPEGSSISLAKESQPAKETKPAQSSSTPGQISMLDIQNVRLRPKDDKAAPTTAQRVQLEAEAPRQPAPTHVAQALTLTELDGSPQPVKKPAVKPAPSPKVAPKVAPKAV